MDLGFNLAPSNRDLKDPTSRQNFGDTSGLLCKNDPILCPKHFFLDCKLYDDARVQLFTKLDGLLEKRVSNYTKNNLCEILLSGEKPHIPDKYQHNKLIFYAVQRYICKTKRL